MSKPSKFANIFNATSEPEPAEVAEAPSPPAPRPVEVEAAPPAPPPAKVPNGPGRPPGMRTDKTFTQCTAYLPKALRKQVNLALTEDERPGGFSVLVADLLSEWLTKRASK